MTFPLYMKDAFNYPVAMALAVAIGFFFGFALERAGFGRARILAAQFYGTDMRVLKVMFSAIVTATVGLGLLGAVGVVDLAAISIPETFLWPQVVGGFVLGMGFVISGYCPGTAVVATASGNVDGIFALLGVGLGAIGFGFLYPWLESFYLSSSLGVSTFPELFGIPWAVVAAHVVLMAVGAFVFAEWVERWLARRSGRPAPESPVRLRRGIFVGFGAAAAVGVLAVVVMPRADASGPEAEAVAEVSAHELAEDLVRAGAAHYLVDLRPHEVCAAARISGAMCRPEGDDAARFLADLPATRKLVVYDADGRAPLPDGFSSFTGDKARLRGGFAAFASAVLEAPTPPENPSADDLRSYRMASALHAHFTDAKGAKQAPVELKVKAVKRSIKKGGGC